MALDFLFQGEALPNVTTSSTAEQFGPAWYQQYLGQLFGRTSSIAGEPYQAYTGQRVAGLTPDQTNAYGMVRDNMGRYDPAVSTGIDYATKAGAGFNEGDFNQYMNPYISNVVDTIAERGGRNLTENLLPGVNQTFTGAGQFGSSRNQEFTNRALRDTQEGVLAEQGRALSQGFSDSMGAYQQGQQQQLQAGQGLGSLAGQGQSLGLQGAAALEGVGAAQQQQGQQNLDVGYQDFLSQRDYPRENVGLMSNVLRGVQIPMSTTETSTGPANVNQLSPSPLGQLVGAAGSSYALGKQFGYFKRGGPVRGIGGYRSADGSPPRRTINRLSEYTRAA